jgi:hypothetical protein
MLILSAYMLKLFSSSCNLFGLFLKYHLRGEADRNMRVFLWNRHSLGGVPACLVHSILCTFVNQMHHSYLGQCAQLRVNLGSPIYRTML